jgi:hypothetical protein
VRVNDIPVVIVVVSALVLTGWRSALAFMGIYLVFVVAMIPFLPPAPAQGALLVADLPGYEGFAPAQTDPPPVVQAMIQHWPALARKAIANLLHDLLLIPQSGNAYILLPTMAASVVGALLGHRLLAILLAAYGASLLFISVIVVGTGYLVHFALAFYIAAAAFLVRYAPSRRAAVTVAVVLVSIAMFAAELRELDRGRFAAASTAHAYLGAAARIAELSHPSDTVITDAPATVGFHSGRRSFNIPLRFADLPRVEREIGGARLLVLRRGQMWDASGYPDPAWRAVYGSDRILDYVLVDSVGQADSEILIYRRP